MNENEQITAYTLFTKTIDGWEIDTGDIYYSLIGAVQESMDRGGEFKIVQLECNPVKEISKEVIEETISKIKILDKIFDHE